MRDTKNNPPARPLGQRSNSSRIYWKIPNKPNVRRLLMPVRKNMLINRILMYRSCFGNHYLTSKWADPVLTSKFPPPISKADDSFPLPPPPSNWSNNFADIPSGTEGRVWQAKIFRAFGVTWGRSVAFRILSHPYLRLRILHSKLCSSKHHWSW